MKKIIFFLLSALLITSCNNEDMNEQSSNKTVAKNEVYISPQMREIINMTDTAKSPIPLEKLIPNIEKLMVKGTTRLTGVQSRAVGDVVSYKGYSNYVLKQLKAPVEISETQSLNLGMTNDPINFPRAGKYYADIYIITLNVINPGGNVEPSIGAEDIIGINPDSLNEKGFKVQEFTPKKYYRLTTYLWALREQDNKGQPTSVISQVLPVANLLESPYDSRPLYIIKNLLTWNYLID